MAAVPLTSAALYERTAILVKDEGLNRLQHANVLVAGVGGVGGHCAEALVRAGIGNVTIVDGDVVMTTNKNRQLIALDSTVGQSKVEVLARRLRDINPRCVVTAVDGFILPEDMDRLLSASHRLVEAHDDGRQTALEPDDDPHSSSSSSSPFTHVVDCIDSVECKVALLQAAVRHRVPCFSSGGAGGRLDPSLVGMKDLTETEGDALLRICRKELKETPGFTWGCVTCVCSAERPVPPLAPVKQDAGGRDRAVNGTISYMPPLYGLLLSSGVIRRAVDPKADGKIAAELKKRMKKAAEKRVVVIKSTNDS